MRIDYDKNNDLLYMRFEEGKKQIMNKRLTDYIVLDMDDEKIIGIEFMDASRYLNVEGILPFSEGHNKFPSYQRSLQCEV